MASLVEILSSWTLRTNTESNLQADVEQVLIDEGIPFRREFAFNANDRIDFLANKSDGIECKIGGACGEVLRQLSRYAYCEQCGSILLVTRKATHRKIDGVVINGKTINVLWINDL